MRRRCAAFLAPRDAPLRRFERAFGLAIPAGREDACAIREGREGFQSEVYACLSSSRGEWMHGNIGAGEAHIPAVRFPADRDRLGRALQRARPAHRDTANLGEDQEAVVERRAVAELLEGERVVTGRAPWKRGKPAFSPACIATKERLIRLVEPRQHILQDMRVDGGVLRKRSTDVLEFGFLLHSARRETPRTTVGGDALL